MSDRDYYEILGLTPRADGAMVDQAYWHLVRKYQALSATNSRAQRLIDELNEAYGVLGNPTLRARYDAFRDDVLIRRGMIQPVTSKPKQKKAEKAHKTTATAVSGEPKKRRSIGLPQVRVQHWRTYSISAIIALLAFAAAWQGVNIVFVAVTLAAGLAFSLTPALGRHMADMSFEMPAVAMRSMPEIKAPRLNLGEIQASAMRELGANQKDEGIDADVLRQSTAETIARWRRSVGLKVVEPDAVDDATASAPVLDLAPDASPTDDGEDPFGAVMDILRGSAKTPERI